MTNRRPRRKACRRYDDPEHAHELTFTCHLRLPLLNRDRTRHWLIESLRETRSKLDVDIWACAFMPEHAHVLIHPRNQEYEISQVLWHIKTPVARRAVAYLEAEAPDYLHKLEVRRSDGKFGRRFWLAGGGYDRNVVEHSTVRAVIEYIHLNPVRRGLCPRPKDWTWSSAAWYAGIRPVPLEIDELTLDWG